MRSMPFTAGDWPPCAQSRRPHRTRLILEAEPLQALLHQRPRAFGKPRSTWTLRLAADVCWERGLTPYQVSLETIRQVLKRLGVNWRRPSGGSPARSPVCVKRAARSAEAP